MGVVSILLADGSRDDVLGHSSFDFLVHSSPFASVSITGSSVRRCSVHQRLYLSELGSEATMSGLSSLEAPVRRTVVLVSIALTE